MRIPIRIPIRITIYEITNVKSNSNNICTHNQLYGIEYIFLLPIW